MCSKMVLKDPHKEFRFNRGLVLKVLLRYLGKSSRFYNRNSHRRSSRFYIQKEFSDKVHKVLQQEFREEVLKVLQ